MIRKVYEVDPMVLSQVRRGFLSRLDLRERFSRLLTLRPARRYSPAMGRRGDLLFGAGIRHAVENGTLKIGVNRLLLLRGLERQLSYAVSGVFKGVGVFL